MPDLGHKPKQATKLQILVSFAAVVNKVQSNRKARSLESADWGFQVWDVLSEVSGSFPCQKRHDLCQNYWGRGISRLANEKHIDFSCAIVEQTTLNGVSKYSEVLETTLDCPTYHYTASFERRRNPCRGLKTVK